MVLQFGIEKVLEFVNNLYKIIIMFVFVYLFFNFIIYLFFNFIIYLFFNFIIFYMTDWSRYNCNKLSKKY